MPPEVGSRLRKHKLSWGKTLMLFGAACLVLWFGAAAAIWTHLRWQRNIEAAAFANTALPWRWNTLRGQIGRSYIHQAEVATASSEYSRAIHLYRSGLARDPANQIGRISLARLYVAAKRPDLAQALLINGLLLHGSDPVYVESTLRVLHDFQADSELRAACEALLQSSPSQEVRITAAKFAALVHFHRGDFDRAEALLRSHRLDLAPDGALLQARMDAERGFTELAIIRLENLVSEGAASDEAYLLLGQMHRRLGQSRKTELIATARLANSPLSFQPRIDFLHLHLERGADQAFSREADSYFRHFGENQEALLALADFAAQTGRPDLAQRVETHFRLRSWPLDAAALLAAEAHLISGDNATGLDLLVAAARQADWTTRHGAVLDGLQAIALFGLNRPDEARLHLEHLLTRPNLCAENLQAIARLLVARHHAKAARALLEKAVALDPLNQVALTDLVRLDAADRHFDNFPAHVRRLMEMRHPSREVLLQAARSWGSDLNLLHPDQPALLAELQDRLNRGAAGRF